MGRRAFTLIELLVAVSLVALLVAILLPTLANARDSGEALRCRSNQRQIMLGFLSVLPDNKYLTPAIYRPQYDDPTVSQYIKAAYPGIGALRFSDPKDDSLFVLCPTTENRFDRPGYGGGVVSFAFNTRLRRNGAPGETDRIPWDTIPSPSSHPWITDAWVLPEQVTSRYFGGKLTRGGTWGVGYYHDESGNTVFADGSAVSCLPSDLDRADEAGVPLWLTGSR